MKVKSRVTGVVIEVSEEAGRVLVPGIYELVDERDDVKPKPRTPGQAKGRKPQ